MFKTNMIAAAAIGLTLGAAAATATPAAAKTTKVYYSDLNLSSPEGQRKLDHRIEIAARDVCDYNRTATGTRIRSAEATECYVQARANVREQVASAVTRSNSAQHFAISQ
ncbi:MAG: UrcA family protein [Novosphingobium sp.]|uniref:UrcA family protein n=1 Tax=Novosphingobium sp. TaxID=1874826 RepID=UPI0012C61202|nr:UrcA family protein [Novosphingobium sp.]MPS67474.1 UrcA family protein [Novosphingobium sp.]